jgi:hypothetical protein
MVKRFAVCAVVTGVFCSLGTAGAHTGSPEAATVARFSAAAVAPALQQHLRDERAAARFQETAPTQAPKKKDRLWNGLLIGAGVGLAAGVLLASAETDDCEPFEAMVCAQGAGLDMLVGTVAGAGVGLLLDAIW